VRAGAALAAVVLLAACATPSAETCDPVQCVALGGSLVRQSSDGPQGRQGFRIESPRLRVSRPLQPEPVGVDAAGIDNRERRIVPRDARSLRAMTHP
jgi:hypothetical protein